ncbi:hypothetical protein ACHAW6_009504 [Cyclotella cf. meneghiniana]
MPASTLPARTLPIHSNNDDDEASQSSGRSNASSFCPPFPNDEALDAYLASIAPPRELICPITQELLRDPVLCSDGHTYERSSLVTWFGMGRNRSPVTNSLLEDTSPNLLVPNLAVGSMANLHREKLGKRLWSVCEGVYRRGGRCDDGGVRIEGLVDAGADVNARGVGGNTPLHLLILSGNIHLAVHLLNHDANVTLTNDAGLDCIATAEDMMQKIQRRRGNVSNDATGQVVHVAEWRDFIEELKRRETLEKARMEARERARTQANEEHRERQRTLASNARSNSNSDANATNERGLGRLEDGIGYFPSLAALQFQSSIPGPSPSVAPYEIKEKERLDRILKIVGGIVLLYFLLS